MSSYGQFCPVAKAAQLFCQRWTPLIVRDLASGPLRFSELQRGVPLMSPTLLSRRLKELEAEGIVERDGRRYALTEAGGELIPMVVMLGTWGQRWTRRTLQREEVDLGLFLWAFERSVDPQAFQRARTVVELELRDQPAKKRYWWLLHEGTAVQLCLERPTSEADLFISATLRTMIYVWRGDLALRDAMDAGRIEVHGSARLMRAVPRWFGISTLAHVPSQRR